MVVLGVFKLFLEFSLGILILVIVYQFLELGKFVLFLERLVDIFFTGFVSFAHLIIINVLHEILVQLLLLDLIIERCLLVNMESTDHFFFDFLLIYFEGLKEEIFTISFAFVGVEDFVSFELLYVLRNCEALSPLIFASDDASCSFVCLHPVQFNSVPRLDPMNLFKATALGIKRKGCSILQNHNASL